ncbi:hypothetical protein [Streptomyces iconiensis]|uniref:Peptidoglycan binding domain-containing protein n=1 Tax=Streptomyces iconiensis TaxID=1384038 RepID=A0ABT7A7U8_9ACTN|nr:hypothetical protein [Streptomyces iconiensis]MDJ1136708.1 hypothetical protein [Streptomyces iconiensis]
MSRETDSSSSGPKGRTPGSGSSYPPGTEPYGTSGAGVGPADQGAEPESRARSKKGKSDEPRTETTLTTRIRINIPGSRPIPPVVMRTPVSEEEGEAQDAGEENGPDAATTPGNGAGPGAGPAAASGAGPFGPNGGPFSGNGAAAVTGSGASTGSVTATSPLPKVPSTPGAGAHAPSGAAPASAPAPVSASAPASASASASGGGEGQGSDDTSGTGEFTQQTSDWFAPRKSKSAPPPSSEPSSAQSSGGAGRGGGKGGDRPDLPYFNEPPARGESDERDAQRESTDGTGTRIPFPAVGSPQDTPADGLPLLDPSLGRGAGTQAPGGPSGPTSGPATGDMPVPHTPRTEGAPQPPVPGPLAAPDGPGTPGTSGAPGEPPAHSTLGLGTGPAPFAPDGVGTAMYGTGGPDESAGAGGSLRAGNPVVSGVPHGAPDGGPAAAPQGPASPAAPAPAPAPAAKRKGGRNKLVLAGVAVVGIVGVAYGTGLLLDHADVPKGTTVLGVDIGGLTKHEAVNKLDEGLGGRTTEPFTIVAAGQKAELKPGVAGLTFDTEATVRAAAGRDYNPVSVIGSLFGMGRDADPAVKVDEAKMESALARVTAETGDTGGGPSDGMVKFVNGKAVAVKGKPHKGVDLDKSSGTLEKAYKQRAISGQNKPVTLPVTLQQPSVTDAQLQEAVKGPARTAMSGWVWLEAGDVKVPFSQKTMGKFLTMRPGGGKLQFVIDPKALKATYGTAFDNVVVQGGAGAVKMTPRHAASAMVQALQKKAPPEPGERVAKVPGATSQ